MDMTPNIIKEDSSNNLNAKLEEDLDDLQISTINNNDINDGVFDNRVSSRTDDVDKFSSIGKRSYAPVFGSVAVSNSDNVQFGDTTHFHGPVTIIHNNTGVENVSYTHTEDDSEPKRETYSTTTKCDEPPVRKFQIHSWVKVVISAVFVILIAVTCALALLIPRNNNSSNDTMTEMEAELETNTLLIAPNHLRIVPRADWLAQPVENALDKIRQPVPWVIVTHTATESCYSQSECVYHVRSIQMYHIESRKWFDIGYNFLVGGDGSAYLGRGWDSVGAHTLGYNRYSIAIAFIGTFNNEAPPQRQIEACEKLIKLGVQLGKLKEDYKLFAHRQLASTLSPGDKLFDIIKTWPHFVKDVTNITELIPNY
ncbi:peptidoglycan-recognition protein SB1-like isoform X2 [Achroia grisella]|uniref:peptidoglycan-recognition protein SB1-like isoform X2 n=1 Tax=Achroia grisella TaxID=688607 RepID=UPI0027D2B4FF|nr:peptidoglycan-recognition protein SB1-like isoform X2 [Achroia grisella]